MQRFLYITLMYLALGISGHAYADLYFMDPPWFTDPDKPDTIDCRKNGRDVIWNQPVHIFSCPIEGITLGYFRAMVHDDETGDNRIQNIPYYNRILCQDGYCTRERSDIPEGRATGLAQGDSVVVTAPMGWYVVASGTEAVTAHRWGTGPYADQFPQIILWGDADPVSTSNETTYDVWCNPRADYCTYTTNGQRLQLDRNELDQYIPMADPQQADCYSTEWVCFNRNGDVVGLNPDMY